MIDANLFFSEEVIKAINIMCEAHKGEEDKNGIPYILYPFHLAERMTRKVSVIAALLSRVLENSDWTIDRLRVEGIREDVLVVLELLTYKNNVPYLKYIKLITTNKIATEVKIAELGFKISELMFSEDVYECGDKEIQLELYKEALSMLEIAYYDIWS